jgi:transposase-like protein
LHGNPREGRHAVRAARQRSQAWLAQLGQELGINPKTVAKWRKRATVEDLKTGTREPRSTVLTEGEETMVFAIRRHTLLPVEFERQANDPGDRL